MNCAGPRDHLPLNSWYKRLSVVHGRSGRLNMWHGHLGGLCTNRDASVSGEEFDERRLLSSVAR
jgi:hypothetical protein